jgi:hypothetical protein
MESYDLLQCIDRVLDGFGSSAKQAVYLNLAIRKGIPHESMLEHPDALTATLQEVFDESSYVVKRAIVREIQSVFDLDIAVDPKRFEESIELAFNQIPGNIYR